MSSYERPDTRTTTGPVSGAAYPGGKDSGLLVANTGNAPSPPELAPETWREELGLDVVGQEGARARYWSGPTPTPGSLVPLSGAERWEQIVPGAGASIGVRG